MMKSNSLKKIFGGLLVPVGWTIFIQTLLCLPGSKLHGPQLFPHYDKVVHVIFFGTMVVLWCYYFSYRLSDNNRLKKIFFIIFMAAAINGIVIEYVQLYFIPMRSFDEVDIIADILGASIAYG